MLIKTSGPPGCLQGITKSYISAPGRTIGYVKGDTTILLATYTYTEEMGDFIYKLLLENIDEIRLILGVASNDET